MKLYILILFSCVFVANSKILPSFIPQCRRNHPNFVGCVKSAIEVVRPYLKNGIPAINVPSYEPLLIPELVINLKLAQPKIRVTLNNSKVYNTSLFIINNLKIDLKRYTAEISMMTPRIFVDAEYEIIGRYFLMPIAMNGRLEGDFTNCAVTVRVTTNFRTINGVKHLQIDRFNSRVRVGSGRFKLIDTGFNAIISARAEKYFNKHNRLVLNRINSMVESMYTALFKAHANKILEKIPLSELVPDV